MEWTTARVIVLLLLVLIGVGTLMAPLLSYVTMGWAIKRKDVLDGLSAEACLAYFAMFSTSSDKPTDPSEAQTQFEALYSKWYGRKFFVIPGVLLFLTSTVIVGAIALTGLERFGYLSNPFIDLPNTAMAALAGAYLWVANDHTSRARQLDLSSSDVHWAVLRLVIAIPMGYAFAAIAAESAGPFVAFAIGAFPLATLTSMLRTVAEKRLSLAPTAEEVQEDIIKLQGISKAIVERLKNEDISTITQVAYCDPVRLVMRSNLSFTFVTDCMNQALAWTYLEDNLAILRPLSLRGATEIRNFIEAYDNHDCSPQEHALAVNALPKLAAAVKQDPSTLELTLREIAGDPYTYFLSSVWATTGGAIASPAAPSGPPAT